MGSISLHFFNEKLNDDFTNKANELAKSCGVSDLGKYVGEDSNAISEIATLENFYEYIQHLYALGMNMILQGNGMAGITASDDSIMTFEDAATKLYENYFE